MTHEQAKDLLPWYAAESLSDAERKAVAEHLEACADCTRELAEFRAIQLAETELSTDVPEAPANLLDQALAQIDEYEAGRAAEASPHPEPKQGSWWDAFWNPQPSLARAVMAAQFALLLALGAGLFLRDGDSGYEVLGGPGDGSTISIQFVETATEAEIRSLLEDVEGSLVDGPSAIGLYTVRVPIAPEAAGDLDILIDRLTSQESIVRFAARGP